MEVNKQSHLDYSAIPVSFSEEDELLRRVLAARQAAEPCKPLSDVAATLGISEVEAHEILREIRNQKAVEYEKGRVNKGLIREKRVIRLAFLFSLIFLELVVGGAYFASRLADSSHDTGSGLDTSSPTAPRAIPAVMVKTNPNP